MMGNRFIKLYDKILKWEWYSDINTFRLFIHLLLKANYKDLNFNGRKILRGQLVTSLTGLSSQTGLSVRQVRVSLDKLKMTGEVTSSSYARYSIITIVRYDEYQSNDRLDDKLMTGSTSSKRQADDRLVTRSMTTSIDNIEQIEKIENVEKVESKRTASRFTPPAKEEIFDYCMDNGYSLNVDKFYDHYTANGWMVGKNKMKDWKAAVRYWVQNDKEQPVKQKPTKTVTAQQYTQRDYQDEQAEAWAQQLAMMNSGGGDV